MEKITNRINKMRNDVSMNNEKCNKIFNINGKGLKLHERKNPQLLYAITLKLLNLVEEG